MDTLIFLYLNGLIIAYCFIIIFWGKSMNSKTILSSIVLIFIFAFILVMGGCKSGSGDIEGNTETGAVTSDENTVSEENNPETENNPTDQENGESEQEDENNNGEATVEDDDPDSGEIEEIPEFVELSAKHVGGTPGSITMFFDLITGEVSGDLEMKYSEVWLDGTQTVVCIYNIEGHIKGIMDLETRIITADFTGEAYSDDRGCYSGELQFSMKGKIREDYSVARGTTTYGGVDWSVFD